jgi:hypothetical protein
MMDEMECDGNGVVNTNRRWSCTAVSHLMMSGFSHADPIGTSAGRRAKPPNFAVLARVDLVSLSAAALDVCCTSTLVFSAIFGSSGNINNGWSS